MSASTLSETESSETASALSASAHEGLSRSGSLHSNRSGSLRKDPHISPLNSISLPLSDQLTPIDLGIRTGYFSKEQILSHELYSRDIDFQLDQKRLLAERGPQLPHENMYADYILVAADVVSGYTLHSPVASGGASSLLFFASNDASGARVIIKLSPNYLASIHVARFLNEWHITSGINPARLRRLWSNTDLYSPYTSMTSINLGDMSQYSLLRQPLTLPKGIPGILYPVRALNVDHSKNNIPQRRMALVYHDHDYRNLRDYYRDKSHYSLVEATSLESGSGRQGLTDTNLAENSLYERLLRQTLGTNLSFSDDSPGRQRPKAPITVVNILMDVAYVLNVLAQCHESNVVHNGVTSTNILRSTDPNVGTTIESPLVLTGWDFAFAIATEDSSHSFRKNNLAEILDLLPYMAPENLGETTGRVDYRSDIYSIGVVLYELLLDCLPFRSDNPLQLKKMIFTHKPIPLKLVGSPWISSDLSDIVMRCLEKEPKDRYHDVYSLIAELQRVIDHYKRNIDKLSLAGELTDQDSRIVTVPKEKIGKPPIFRTNMVQWQEKNIRTQMHNCFKAHKNNCQFLLVTGDSGMGKSSTIREIKVSAISKFNFIVHWDYNCSGTKASKYSFLLYGLHSIVKQILASSKSVISEWRHILVTQIDADVSILYQSIPDLEILMGSRYSDIVSKKSNKHVGLKSVQIIPPMTDRAGGTIGEFERKNGKSHRSNYFDDQSLNVELRYKHIIKRFYSLISVRGLTIILDDLHWCPLEEFLLLKEIISYCLHDSTNPKISIIGAYRTGEPACDLDKPLMNLDKLRAWMTFDKLEYHEFHLSPLDLREMVHFVNHSRYLGTEQLSNLDIEKIHEISKGNLLLLNFFIRWVRLISPDRKLQFHDGLRTAPSVSGLPDLLQKLLALCITKDVESLLKYAAIISNNGTFRISDLLIVTGLSLTEVFEILQICVEFEAIFPSGIYYKVPFHLMSRDDFPFDISDSTVWDLTAESSYSFNHDQIQLFLLQSMHESGEFAKIHRECGLRYFRKHSSESNTNVNDYLIMATHFLRSCKVAKDNEKDIFYNALVGGGKIALSTSSPELALEFFRSSRQFIEPTDKERKIKNMLTICHINYLLKNYEKCISLIQEAEISFREESSTFLNIKIRCLFQMRNFKSGLKKTLDVLKSLDVEISPDPRDCEKIVEKNFRKIPFSVADIRNMKNLKISTKKNFLLVADLISEAISPTYILGMSQLRLALITQLVLLMLEYGKCAACAIPLIHLANYFGGRTKNRSILKARELCLIALDIARDDSTSSTFMVEKINEAYVTYFSVFNQNYNLEANSDSLARLIGLGVVEAQDKVMSLLVTMSQVFISTGGISSASLDQIKRKNVIFETEDENLVFSNIVKLWSGKMSLEVYKSYFKHFQSLRRYDYEFIYLSEVVIWCSSQGLYNEASDIILQRSHHVLKQLPITPLSINYQFNAAICLIQNTCASTRLSGLALARRLDKLFEIFAIDCPANFKVKSLVLKACLLATTSGASSLVILDAFEDAIEIANEKNAWLDTANANYLCALWLASTNQNLKRITRHVQNAYSAFSTVKSYSIAERLKREFSASFDEFNWAGVAKIKLKSDFRGFSGALDSLSLFSPIDSECSRDEYFTQETVTEENEKTLKRTNSKSSPSNIKDPASTNEDLSRAINLCLRITESSSPDSIFASLLESVLLVSGLNYGAVVLNNDNEALVQFISTYNNMYKIDYEPMTSASDLVPYSLIVDCLMKGETIGGTTSSEDFEKQYGGNSYFAHNSCSSCVCIPIKTSTILGALYLERSVEQNDMFMSTTAIDSERINLLELLCAHAAVSLNKALIYEELEKAKSAAEDATAEKASFLANMSHEIRTPFNSLFACSLFLLDTDLTLAQQEYVETIKNSSLVTLNIIDGILAFSKIEHGSFILNNAPFSIVETVESAIQISSEQANDNGLDLMYFNHCPDAEIVVGDATRVRQIIINLVGNAVKFTLKGYVKVSIEADRITDERYLFRIIVEDTGIGIPQSIKSKVFGAFSQGDGSSIRVHGGAGLGLAISLKLAHIMDGGISFESKEGEGSTFCFSCPFEIEAPQKNKTLFPVCVTLVLKEELTRDSLKEFLEFYGAKVDIKENLIDVENNSSDLLLVGKSILERADTGKEALRSLKPRVILITSFGLAHLDETLKEMDIDGVIFTPIKRDKIKSVLYETVSRSLKGVAKEILDPALEKPQLLGDKYPLRILLAEDNPINLKVASQHLKKLGYIADHAKDGITALEKCEERLRKKEKYDVILMDIQMPRKDGIVATLELRKSFTDRGLMEFMPQVVALTANVAGEDRELCLKAGMVDFISKPVLPEVLLRVLEKVARRGYSGE